MSRVSDPSTRQTHKPLHKFGCWAWSGGVVQERGCGGGSSGDVFPSGDGGCEVSPLSKMLSISIHRVSGSCRLLGELGEPLSARSMI